MSDAPSRLSVSGESPLAEARSPRLARAGARLILGRWRWLQISLLLAILVVYIAAIAGLELYHAPSWAIFPLVGLLFLSSFVSLRIAQVFVTRAVLRGWRARGLQAANALSYLVEDDAFVISGVASVTRLRWACVGEIAPAGRSHWMIPAAGLFYYLPRRFFASPADEAAFLDAMLQRMPQAARARSAEARKLTAFE